MSCSPPIADVMAEGLVDFLDAIRIVGVDGCTGLIAWRNPRCRAWVTNQHDPVGPGRLVIIFTTDMRVDISNFHLCCAKKGAPRYARVSVSLW